MARDNDGEEGSRPKAPKVGYAEPPVQHQFKPGVSGNLRGRPKKRRQPGRRADATVADLVITEAYRPITIRENDEPVTLPLIQAVVRSLGVAAVKGSHHAQLAITALVQAAEERRNNDKQSLYQAVVEYKLSWAEIFEQCDRDGVPRPDPLPHPDDLAFSARTGEVFYNGPFDDAEKADWNKFAEIKVSALLDIEEARKDMKRHKDLREAFEDEIAHDQKLIDLVDRTFPDEETRRKPNFNINRWRQSQERWQELRAARSKLSKRTS